MLNKTIKMLNSKEEEALRNKLYDARLIKWKKKGKKCKETKDKLMDEFRDCECRFIAHKPDHCNGTCPKQ